MELNVVGVVSEDTNTTAIATTKTKTKQQTMRIITNYDNDDDEDNDDQHHHHHHQQQSLSDTSSLLSSPLSRSPSPPSSALKSLFHSYPSPPPSQEDSGGPPSPDNTSCSSTQNDENNNNNNNNNTDAAVTRPAKRRRISSTNTRSPLPRDTKRLNLDQVSCSSEHQEQLMRLVGGLKNKRKIVVIAGAGISVSAGVPDFRSSTGLFKSLQAEHKLKSSGKHLFDASVYRDASSTSSFHSMVRSLSELVTTAHPTPFHHLLARLAREGRLLRLYTQNVDGIDTSMEPLATQVPLPRKGPWPKTIQVHGGLEHMTCTKCHALSSFKPELFHGPVPPECTTCLQMDHVRTEVAGKRSHGVGKLRPRMVLYNEHNPDDEAIGAVTRADMRTRPDAVIVVGTSLKIPGVRRIVKEMCSIVRDRRDGLTVWINNDPEPSGKDFENSWDLIVKGSCDDVAGHVALRQWDDDSTDEVQEVTDQELKESRERSQASVVVVTPSKAIKLKSFRSDEHDDSSFLTPPSPPLESPRPLTEEDVSPGTGEFTFRLELRPSPPASSKSHRGSFGKMSAKPGGTVKKERKKPGPKPGSKHLNATDKTASVKPKGGAEVGTKRTSSGTVKQQQQKQQNQQPKQAKRAKVTTNSAKINAVFKASKSAATSAAAGGEKFAAKGAASTVSNLKIKLPRASPTNAALPLREEIQTKNERIIVVTPKKENKTVSSTPATPTPLRSTNRLAANNTLPRTMSPIRFPNLQRALQQQQQQQQQH